MCVNTKYINGEKWLKNCIHIMIYIPILGCHIFRKSESIVFPCLGKENVGGVRL